MGSSAPDSQRGGAADASVPPGATDDLVSEAVAELYGTDPQQFTERRKALAAAAKASGDGAAARQIAALRKPTRAAWVVNRLTRENPAAPARLASLATALRAAEKAKDGPRLRELSAARGQLIDALTGQALAAADIADPHAALRDEVSATLTAALADPEVAAGFAAGTLTRAAEWAGFGLALSGTPDGEADAAEPARPVKAPAPLAEVRLLKESRRGQAGRAGQGGRPGQVREQTQGLGEETERREETERKEGLAEEARRRRERLAEETAARLAEEAAQAAARRRKSFEDAERAVAFAAAVASGAAAAEDGLEIEVRDLEERLTRARAKLADARLSARRAEAAERKARLTLEHLPRPGEGA